VGAVRVAQGRGLAHAAKDGDLRREQEPEVPDATTRLARTERAPPRVVSLLRGLVRSPTVRTGAVPMRAWGGALVAGLALAWASPGAAQVPVPVLPPVDQFKTRLDYHGAPGCDVKENFEQAVRVELYKWEVWSAAAKWRLEMTVTATAKGYSGDAVLVDPQGAELPLKKVEGLEKCIDVLQAVALALSVRLVPRKPKLAAVLPPAPPAPPSPQELPPLDPLPPPPPPKPPIVFRVGAAFVGDYATVPQLVPGVAATLGARYTWFSAAVEGRWDPRASLPLANTGSLSVARLTGGVALCGHIAVFAPCLLGQASEIQTVGTWPGAPTTTIARGAVGLRAEADLPLWRRLIFLAPMVDVLAPFALSVSPPSGVTNSLRVNAAVGLEVLVEYAP
jgi:hypothetical protein